jgi:hypothetical protein
MLLRSGFGPGAFGANAPVPICVTGSHIQKGVMALPSAATYIQETTAGADATNTVVATYPNATVAGDLLVAAVIVDGTHTINTCNDGSAWTRAARSINGALLTDIWYLEGAASRTAGTTLTL